MYCPVIEATDSGSLGLTQGFYPVTCTDRLGSTEGRPLLLG